MSHAVLLVVILGLTHPESVIELGGHVFVSDIGQFGVKDGTIKSRSGKGWKVLATGLTDPKGIAALDDSTLVVTDVTEVKTVKLSGKTGVLFPSKNFPSGKKPAFLNDITVGPDGKLYFSDTRENCIFVGDPGTGKVKVLVEIESPNGVVFGPDSTLYIVTFQKPGRIYAYKSGKLTEIFRSHDIDGGDGIVWEPDGKLIVSGFISGKIVEVNPVTGKHRVLKSRLKTPADINLSSDGKTLYVPLLQAGKVISMEIKK